MVCVRSIRMLDTSGMSFSYVLIMMIFLNFIHKKSLMWMLKRLEFFFYDIIIIVDSRKTDSFYKLKKRSTSINSMFYVVVISVNLNNMLQSGYLSPYLFLGLSILICVTYLPIGWLKKHWGSIFGSVGWGLVCGCEYWVYQSKINKIKYNCHMWCH